MATRSRTRGASKWRMFERLIPPQIKLGRDPQADLGDKLDELAYLYSEDPGRVHTPLGNGTPTLDAARRRRRKRRLLEEITGNRVTREEFLREVRLLRASRLQTPQDYWSALNDYLPIPVVLEYTPLYRDREDTLGASSYDPLRNRIRIGLPQRLGWWNRQYALAHESGHVAANHEFPVLDPAGCIAGYQRPQTGLTRLPPVREELPRAAVLDLQDEEAELRARYTWLVCGLGSQMLDVGDAKQLS